VLIRQAEETLGTRLFDRTTRSLVPTLAAEDAFGVAERILQDAADDSNLPPPMSAD
jgi:DNA-binding transcriptional LysR family regulator